MAVRYKLFRLSRACCKLGLARSYELPYAPPPNNSPRIFTFLTGAFSDYKMPENRQKPENSHPCTIQQILIPLLVPPYSTYCSHSWCHHTAHFASTPGATIQHILCHHTTNIASTPGATIQQIFLPLLVTQYSTYCFHSWCHHTAHIASTAGATIQHILLPLLVPPYSTYCFHSWCHHTAHIDSTPDATIQHILLPFLVPPYSIYCFHSWCHHTAHIASTPDATTQHILIPLLVPPYNKYCFHVTLFHLCELSPMISQNAKYPSYKECRMLLVGLWSAATDGNMKPGLKRLHWLSMKQHVQYSVQLCIQHSILDWRHLTSLTYSNKVRLEWTTSNNDCHLAADMVTELSQYMLHFCGILFQLRWRKPVAS